MTRARKKIEDRNEFKTMVQVGKISCNLLHDLISPITSLGLHLENIEDEKLTELLEPLSESYRNIKDFINLIQDAVERPEEYKHVKLNSSVTHAVSLGQHKAIRKGVVVNINDETDRKITLHCKRLELYQVIMNLVGNAIDSFDDTIKNNKEILVEIKENKKYLTIQVTDNGSGIKKGNIEKIFDKSFSTKVDGMGIGLSTVKKVVEESFGGEIKIKSKFGKGTKFTIIIPKKTSRIFCNEDF